MTELSPAAQAVLDAVERQLDIDASFRPVAAAALRAAADQVIPADEREPYVPDYPDSNQIAPWHEWMERKRNRADLLAIATELEAGR